jgi:transposase
MEDVLDLYAEPYDPERPVVCFDEKSLQLLAHTRPPLRVARREPARQDYEYKRQGTANLFIAVEPLAGWRQVTVTEQRTKVDFAAEMQQLVDVHYPAAKCIRVVMDNLNTHKLASLYDAFAPAEANRIRHRLEFHYTPKHASWLNMAEIEISVLSRQCLQRRLPDKGVLEKETAAWQIQRNQDRERIRWHFTVGDARSKLSRLYPKTS